MQDIQKIINFIVASNWLILLFLGIIALMLTPIKFALGIIYGGLLVAINFHLLKKTLYKTIDSKLVSKKKRLLMGRILVHYYLRFAITAIIIFLLISKHIVHPIGLIAGLSVFVASMFIITMLEFLKLFFKEAV